MEQRGRFTDSARDLSGGLCESVDCHSDEFFVRKRIRAWYGALTKIKEDKALYHKWIFKEDKGLIP